MPLLFDQNLSYKLIDRLKDIYPGSIHIKQINLHNASDLEIWQYAKDNNYHIVSFDADFYELSIIKGFPPKIVWLRCENSSTKNLVKLFIEKRQNILEFLQDEQNAYIELY